MMPVNKALYIEHIGFYMRKCKVCFVSKYLFKYLFICIYVHTYNHQKHKFHRKQNK